MITQRLFIVEATRNCICFRKPTSQRQDGRSVTGEQNDRDHQQNVTLYPRFVFQWHFIPRFKISNLIPGKIYQEIKASDSKKQNKKPTARMDRSKTQLFLTHLTASLTVPQTSATEKKLSPTVSEAFKDTPIRHLHKQIAKQYKDSRTCQKADKAHC